MIYFQDMALWSGAWGEKQISSLRQGDRWEDCCSAQMGSHTRGLAGERSSGVFAGGLGEGGEGDRGV